MPEKTYYSLFRAGIIVKALISIGEIISGLAVAFLSYDTLRAIILPLFGDEFSETPRDFVWQFVANEMQRFSATPQSVWAFIFLSHGIVKIFLLTGLWLNKLWVYPVSIVVFILFIIYQFYQLTFTPSIVLWAITIVDIVVVFLVVHEYRYRIAHPGPAQ